MNWWWDIRVLQSQKCGYALPVAAAWVCCHQHCWLWLWKKEGQVGKVADQRPDLATSACTVAHVACTNSTSCMAHMNAINRVSDTENCHSSFTT